MSSSSNTKLMQHDVAIQCTCAVLCPRKPGPGHGNLFHCFVALQLCPRGRVLGNERQVRNDRTASLSCPCAATGTAVVHRLLGGFSGTRRGGGLHYTTPNGGGRPQGQGNSMGQVTWHPVLHFVEALRPPTSVQPCPPPPPARATPLGDLTIAPDGAVGARTPAEGGGVGEMGFCAGPFVFCHNGCCRQRRRNTNFGRKKFFPPKNFPQRICSQNHQRDVGIILSQICWG